MRESNGREPAHDVVVYRAPVDGLVSGGVVEEARVLVAFGLTPDEAIARLRRPASVALDVLVAERTAYDREAIALARQAEGGDALGELHGAVRGLAKDVAGIKKARGGGR